MKYLLLLAGLVAAGGCTIPEHRRAYFRIDNGSADPLIVKASMSVFEKTIVIPPGGFWRGWVIADLLTKEEIKISIVRPPAPK